MRKAITQVRPYLGIVLTSLVLAGCLSSGGGGEDEVAGSTTVPASNNPPSISGSPATSVNAETAYSFTPSASDADGDTLTFSITNRPAWTNFDAATGQLSGTPNNADAGDYTGITISVTDGKDSASLPTFSLRVAAINHAPTISGAPAVQVSVNAGYSFTPSAADEDGDSLSFSIANQPAWTSFNSSNGQLSGLPKTGDEGAYENIQIQVSDGQASTALSAFTVTVVTISDKAASLSWTPPTQNADGSVLEDLAGYYIYFGTTQHEYASEIHIDNAGITDYVVENLDPGIYYFALTAVNAKGLESDLSNVVSREII